MIMLPLTIQQEPIKLLAQIVATSLDLVTSPDPKLNQVIIYNQNFVIPDYEGLFVVLEWLSGKPVGTKNYIDTDVDGNDVEVQQVAQTEMIQIDIMSRNNDARIRKEEVIMALGSLAAQQAMDLNQFKIARFPQQMVDASALEGAGRLNRYTATVLVNALYTKTVKTDKFYTTIQTPIVKRS